jgi:hypothetical protein
MKRNQKHSKENIFPVIEAWQEGGQSQAKFCKENKLSISTFQYWLKKLIFLKKVEKPLFITKVVATFAICLFNVAPLSAKAQSAATES